VADLKVGCPDLFLFAFHLKLVPFEKVKTSAFGLFPGFLKDELTQTAAVLRLCLHPAVKS